VMFDSILLNGVFGSASTPVRTSSRPFRRWQRFSIREGACWSAGTATRSTIRSRLVWRLHG
jgi:hypothetical protein